MQSSDSIILLWSQFKGPLLGQNRAVKCICHTNSMSTFPALQMVFWVLPEVAVEHRASNQLQIVPPPERGRIICFCKRTGIWVFTSSRQAKSPYHSFKFNSANCYLGSWLFDPLFSTLNVIFDSRMELYSQCINTLFNYFPASIKMEMSLYNQ